MNVDTALLDIDGTLVDSNFQHTLAWQRAFSGVGITVAGWRVRGAIGMGGDRLVAHVAGDEVEEEHGDQVRDSWKREADEMISEVRPLAGAIEMLDALRARGLTVALATSGKPDHTEHALDVLHARTRIDHLTTNDDVDASKPEPDLLTAAAQAVKAERAVMIGDSVWDARAAADAGMPFLGLLAGGTSRAELERAGAVGVYDDPADLLEHLDEALRLCAG